MNNVKISTERHENIKSIKQIIQLNNTITEQKNLLEWSNHRLDQAEESTGKLENRGIGTPPIGRDKGNLKIV